jgi:hypothetical protein
MTLTFTVGDLTIHRIIESEAPLFDPLTFFTTLTQELLAHLVHPPAGERYLSWNNNI